MSATVPYSGHGANVPVSVLAKTADRVEGESIIGLEGTVPPERNRPNVLQ